MDTKEICVMLCISCFVYVVPLILQTVGIFTPMWASNATCDSIGLLYGCCNGSDKDKCETTNGSVEIPAVIFLTVSTVILFSAVVVSWFTLCMIACGNEKDSVVKYCAGYCIVGNPVAGAFAVIGCSSAVSNLSNVQLGFSYYLCLTAGCMTFLPVVLLAVLFAFFCCGAVLYYICNWSEQGSHDTSTSEHESHDNSRTLQRSEDKRMTQQTQQESHDSNKAKTQDRVIIRLKSYANTGREEPTAWGCDDKMINDSVGGKLAGRCVGHGQTQPTKLFTVTGKKIVKMSNAGEIASTTANPPTSRLDTLCLEEYIINSSDSVEEF